MAKKKFGLCTIFIAVIVLTVCVISAGCSGKTEDKMLDLSDVAYLEEIQESGNLTFEWVAEYDAARPILVIFPGESDGSKYSMTLPAEEYIEKSPVYNDNYTVASGIGYKGEGLDRDLSHYWINLLNWNVAIFHWESFTAEDDSADIIAKLYSLPKMRYYKGEGEYETTKVPHNNLTEITAALYSKEISDKLIDPLTKNVPEIRFVGNGVGADLALSVAHYLSYYQKKGMVEKNSLPARLALCDPYISADNMNMPGNKLPWTDISTSSGMISVIDELLEDVVSYGAAVEMIETQEVSKVSVNVEGTVTDQEVISYAYDVEKSEKVQESYDNIMKKVAHLYFKESYSTKFSDSYRSFKRVALDWYLYSIIGSDDTGSTGTGSTIAAGYPRSVSNYNLYYESYAGFNWGVPKMTRPMINNRAMNNDPSESVSNNKGKNYAISAWTPTVYLKALKGISFVQQKKENSAKKIGTDIHGNDLYEVKDYKLEYFASENFQVSDQKDYTIVCGYVYGDVNGDSYINDGFSGIADARLIVTVSKRASSSSTSKLTEITSFETRTDETGFYVIRLADKVKDSEGALSDAGYCIATDHIVSITLVPESHDYYSIGDAVSGKFYKIISGHNFSGYSVEVTIKNYYADAISIANCLVRFNSEN